MSTTRAVVRRQPVLSFHAHAFAIAAIAGGLTLGCTVTQAPIPLVADPVELTALVGRWSGVYSSQETGRSGSIEFSLEAGADTAFGDVVMIPSGFHQPLRPGEPGMMDPPRPTNELLTIRFVRVDGGRVSGVLDPYHDPVCGCPLETTFTGRLVDASTIEGTFVSTGPPGHRTATGRWRVTRSKESRQS